MMYKILHIPSAKYVTGWPTSMCPDFDLYSLQDVLTVLAEARSFTIEKDDCLYLWYRESDGLLHLPFNRDHFEIIEADDV